MAGINLKGIGRNPYAHSYLTYPKTEVILHQKILL